MEEVRSGPTQAVTGLPSRPEPAEYAGKCLPARRPQTTRVSQHGSSSRASVAPPPRVNPTMAGDAQAVGRGGGGYSDFS